MLALRIRSEKSKITAETMARLTTTAHLLVVNFIQIDALQFKSFKLTHISGVLDTTPNIK